MKTARNNCLEKYFHIITRITDTGNKFEQKGRINDINELKIITRITSKRNKNKIEHIARINNRK